MNITIVGAGAIGGVVGGHLARAGHEIVFCDVAVEHVKTIRKDGIRIEGPEETFTVRAQAYTPEELVDREVTLGTILLCVKAQDTEDAVRQLLPLLHTKSYIVSVQNGLCEDVIARIVGRERTVGCFVNFSADYLEPGLIVYGGVSSFVLGELDGRISDRVLELQDILSAWGPVQVSNHIQGYLWAKLSYAALLFATALVDETMATVVRNERYRPTLMELCSEVLEVADLEGMTPIGFDDWEPSLVYPRTSRNEQFLNSQLEKLANRMAANKKTKSGIWRDLAVRKRRTEIDFQLASIVAIGRSHGLSLPLTSKVIEMIHGIEDESRQMGWENLDALKSTYEQKPKEN